MGLTRKTDYKIGDLLKITECTFHDFPIGTTVKVINADWHSYHVVNVTANSSEMRFWWVDENQITPIQKLIK